MTQTSRAGDSIIARRAHCGEFFNSLSQELTSAPSPRSLSVGRGGRTEQCLGLQLPRGGNGDDRLRCNGDAVH